mmetsp:Transcript_29702/g.28407  ORF Transcript_29702/g.28407 Transcript_29702/m.28407 type:complete len:193 (+) Transcript_29702:97-675(+)|eukprot:CAMPEP_0119041322 /NCGR_PEP_ID=MMETSP1177-20130426/11553_1 /TAXON_ID=2985 /ORGANISM="Ochromonas sp, Strain CCMP1899" /LENGTH=192 /DNA_ID=CAMNT_0007007281 /DNA_START=97 /DNA_END=675 /DNA_ORIENTATION=-
MRPMPTHDNVRPPAASNMGTSLYRRAFIIFGSVFALLIGRNLLFRDYTGETKSFLTSIGRSDSIEKIVPKTNADLAKEKKSQLSVFDQMKLNLTMVMTQYKGLRADVDRLQGKNVTDIQWNATELSTAVSAITPLAPPPNTKDKNMKMTSKPLLTKPDATVPTVGTVSLNESAIVAVSTNATDTANSTVKHI